MSSGDPSTYKPIFIALYLIFALFYLWQSYRAHRGLAVPAARLPTDSRTAYIATVGFAMGAASLFLCRVYLSGGFQLLIIAAACVGVIAIFKWQSWSLIEQAFGASITIITLSLAWWSIGEEGLNWFTIVAFAAVFTIIAFLLTIYDGRIAANRSIPTALFLLAGFALLIDLGGYAEPSNPLLTLAHHWGAFIGPALHVRAGLVPFYDIPLQYGVGPTSLIAASCDGPDCWRGTEIIVVGADLLLGLLVLRMALATSYPRNWAWQAAVTLAVFAAVYLWTGYALFGSNVLAYPSSTGLRYVPACIVAYLLFRDQPRWAAVALVPAALWSPESAFMALSIYGLSETARIGISRAISRSLIVFVGSYGSLIVLHRLTFDVWIEPAAFFEYVLHVPGPMPIDPISDALVLAAALLLGGWLLHHRSDDIVIAHRDRVVTFLLFASAIVWFGRSHENNICNIMPFIVLVAVRAMDRSPSNDSRMGDIMGFALAASVAALTLSPWHSVPFDRRATTDIRELVKIIPSLDPGMRQVRQNVPNPGNLGIADFGRVYFRDPSEQLIWTPMDPGSLWAHVPSPRRQLYIKRSSLRLKRSGWAIFEARERYMMDDFAAGYSVKSRRYFDHGVEQPNVSGEGYTLVCFDPRPDLVVNRVGPACP